MMNNFKTFEELQARAEKPLNLKGLKDLASTSEIKNIDYKTVNRIALYAHNQFKKVPNFRRCLILTVDDPYELLLH